jgi:hypothetical protein
MLNFNLYFVDQPYTSHELPPLGEFMHIILHNLLSYECMWAHSCCLTPPTGEELVVEVEPLNTEALDLI